MRTICYLLFVLIAHVCFAQTLTINYQKTPLKEALKDIESKTDLLFSYGEVVIANKFITFSSDEISITSLLKAFSQQSDLTFEKLSALQIIIKKPNTKITICGYLFDKTTYEVLPYATVYVKGNNTNGTSSDENGYFTLEDVEATSKIEIQYLGYNSLDFIAIDLKNEVCNTIYLTTSIQALEDILIQGYITTGLDKNSDGSITVNNQKLGILPGLTEPDVLKSLQLIPGITSLNESASDIQIRGGSQDQNLIYFDNIKLYNTGHFFGIISSINPYVVEKTKIYKSGASPEYGDRISGVIDISTAKKVADSTQIGAGVNGTHADVFVKTPISKSVGIVASARRSYTDVFQTPTYDAMSNKVFQNTKVATNPQSQVIASEEDIKEVQTNNQFFFYDASVNIIIEPSVKDQIRISGLTTKNDLGFSSRDDEDFAEDQLQIENQGASISWEGTKFSKLDHSLKGYYSYFDSFYENIFSEELITKEKNLRKNTVEEYGFDSNLTYEFVPKHTVKAGYQYTNTNVFFQLFRDKLDDNDNDPEDPDDDDVTPVTNTRDFNRVRDNANQTHSVYGEYIFKPKRKSFISLGVRASHYSLLDDLFVEPRLNAEYPLTSFLRVKATAEKRYQTISQLVEFEDTQLRLENQIWTLSNGDDIPVLESTQLSSGLIIDYKGFIFDVDAYVKHIDGLTSFTNGFTNNTSNLSMGQSDIFGVDVLFKKNILDIDIWLGYTFNDVQYTFEEIQAQSFSGNNDITHNFRASTSYNLEDWRFSLGWTYRTGSPFTPVDNFDPANSTITFGEVNSERLPKYHRLDASLLYDFNLSKNKTTRCVFGVSLQNIYSRQIPVSIFYRTDSNPDTEEVELKRIEQLSLGFTPNATFRLYF